jgi:hypothetical protein
MTNVNVKLLFISTPPSAGELSDHHGQFATALGKVGKARPFVNPKMASVFSLLFAKLPPYSAMTLASHRGWMKMSNVLTRPRRTRAGTWVEPGRSPFETNGVRTEKWHRAVFYR